MTLTTRLARVATDAVVRWPRLWPLFRRSMERQFDALAPRWDAMRSGEPFAAFEAALAAIPGPVADALDLGTGTGDGAAAVKRAFPDARVVGADVSEQMLGIARQKVPDVEFVRVDAAALPFPDESFDLVTHANMIPFFDELARVLRPRGSALFAFSLGPRTPIYVSSERLRSELGRRGFTDFAEFAAGPGTALLARRR